MDASSLLNNSINIAVEGLSDEAVAIRILQEVGIHQEPIVYIKRGKQNLKQKIQAYNYAAQYGVWFVLIDLDTVEVCPPKLVQEWLPNPSSGMCFRIAVPQIESWLLADKQGLAQYLKISKDIIPNDPDSLQNAKDVMISIAHRSRNKEIRQDMVHVNGSSLQVGPIYTTRIRDFAFSYWDVENARKSSKSLDRCMRALEKIALSNPL